MSGKLVIIRKLAPNPKKGRRRIKLTSSRKPRRRKALKRTARPHSSVHKFVLQATVQHGAGYQNCYWTGASWSASRAAAKHFKAPPRSMPAGAKKKLPAGWIALNTVPA